MKKVKKFRPNRRFLTQYEVVVRHGNGVVPHHVIEKCRAGSVKEARRMGMETTLHHSSLGDYVYWGFKPIKLLMLIPKRTKRVGGRKKNIRGLKKI